MRVAWCSLAVLRRGSRARWAGRRHEGRTENETGSVRPGRGQDVLGRDSTETCGSERAPRGAGCSADGLQPRFDLQIGPGPQVGTGVTRIECDMVLPIVIDR